MVLHSDMVLHSVGIIALVQCATGNTVSVPIDPAIFSDPLPVRFRSNTNRIDRTWLSSGKSFFLFGCRI